MKYKLSKCPFCGGSALFKHFKVDKDDIRRWIECRECKASAGGYKDDKQTVEAWNRRVEKGVKE